VSESVNQPVSWSVRGNTASVLVCFTDVHFQNLSVQLEADIFWVIFVFVLHVIAQNTSFLPARIT
jgi:hypothetical protein